VAGGRCLVRNIAVTTFAGVGSVAVLGAGGVSYNARVTMLMSVGCNLDRAGNIINVDIEACTAKLCILDLFTQLSVMSTLLWITLIFITRLLS